MEGQRKSVFDRLGLGPHRAPQLRKSGDPFIRKQNDIFQTNNDSWSAESQASSGLMHTTRTTDITSLRSVHTTGRKRKTSSPLDNECVDGPRKQRTRFEMDRKDNESAPKRRVQSTGKIWHCSRDTERRSPNRYRGLSQRNESDDNKAFRDKREDQRCTEQGTIGSDRRKDRNLDMPRRHNDYHTGRRRSTDMGRRKSRSRSRSRHGRRDRKPSSKSKSTRSPTSNSLEKHRERNATNANLYQGTGSNGNRSTVRFRRIGYLALKGMMDSDPSEIIVQLSGNPQGFKEVLTYSKPKPDWIRLLLRNLGKACVSTAVPTLLIELLAAIKEASFVETITHYLLYLKTTSESAEQEDIRQDIRNCIILLNTLASKTQGATAVFLGAFLILNDKVNEFRLTPGFIDTAVLADLERLTKRKEQLCQTTESISGNNSENLPPPEDFRELPICPTEAELKSDQTTYLRKNICKGAYSSIDHYLDVQFRLLREDFVRPLRKGVIQYIKDSDRNRPMRRNQDIRVYHRARILSPSCGDHGLTYLIQFDIGNMTDLSWRRSKRLIHGSMLCLSHDNFKSCYFATVARREIPELSQGIIELGFEEGTETIESLMPFTFVMAETTAFFEAYRPVLAGLQQLQEESLPFKRHIVSCETDVHPPKYLHETTTYDLLNVCSDSIDTQNMSFASARRTISPFGNNSGSRYRPTSPHHDPAPPDINPEPEYYRASSPDSSLSSPDINPEPGHYSALSPDSSLSSPRSMDDTPDQEVRLLSRHQNLIRSRKDLCIVTILEKESWPSADMLDMDASQYRAFRTALTKELVLIQGPPGTGKTYLGLKIAQTLLHNSSQHQLHGRFNKSPMLVVCYTNHALDQFLEGIVKFHQSDVVRVGSRSSSKTLEKYHLTNCRKEYRQDLISIGNRRNGDGGSLSNRSFRLMKSLREKIDVHVAKVKIAKTNILHEDFLRQYMGHDFDLLIHQASVALFQNNRRGRSLIVEWLDIDEIETSTRRKQNYNCRESRLKHVREEYADFAIQANLERMHVFDIIELNTLTGFREPSDLHWRERRDREIKRKTEEFKKDALALGVFEMEKKPQQIGNTQWYKLLGERKQLKKVIQQKLALSGGGDIGNETVPNLWKMDNEQRWKLYNKWVNNYCRAEMKEMEEKCTEYDTTVKQYRELQRHDDKAILKNASVIGMTTTGAAKYLPILKEIQPKIVVVEEAAEVLEAHIITSLNPGCEHLILIGDHKQLKPNPTCYELAKEYNLEVSLFERLINNGVTFDCLELQHRMRPEIAKLMQPIYENLRDHKFVHTYPDIRGVVHNMYFINHTEAEQYNDDIKSPSNEHEAEFLTELCKFFLRQNYHPSKITILTLYSGQMFCLKRLLAKENIGDIHIAVVDNYQGEENDIVLLSLVRSNSEGKIGFLSSRNRVCVALSRAKQGLFMIGNMDLLAAKSKLWNEISIILKKENKIGESLQISCQIHPKDECRTVKNASDFLRKTPNGGCRRICGDRLECGHSCKQFCHSHDKMHDKYLCDSPCTERCPQGHTCTKKCYENCGRCEYTVNTVMPGCAHYQNVPCYMDPQDFSCREIIGIALPCGHLCEVRCGLSNKHQTCAQPVVHTWDECGHGQEVRCGDIEKVSCSEPCTETLRCGHACTGSCSICISGLLHRPCGQRCIRILICGHECNSFCSDCPPCDRPCENRCMHSACTKKCGEPCVPCKEECAWECKHHKCNMLCSEPCDRPRCMEPCDKALTRCGHPCIGVCGEPCPPFCRQCHQESVTRILFGTEDEPDACFIMLEDCRHIVESTSMDRYMDDVDNVNGEIQLKGCPWCKTPIRNSARYGSVISKTLLHIEDVKRKIRGNREKMSGLMSDSERLLHRTSSSDEMVQLWKSCKEYPFVSKIEAFKFQLQLLQSLEILEIKFKASLESSFAEQASLSLKRIAALKRWCKLKRNVLTTQEISESGMERIRLGCHLDLIEFQITWKRKEIEDDVEIQGEIDTAQQVVEQKLKFTPEKEELVKACLKKLEEVGPLSHFGITETERKMIVKSMDLTKGHWFSCQNGHVYAIGECGGAMEQSSCPECRHTIGGQRHSLDSSNTFAPEMDDAEHPAWSDAANLAAIQFEADHDLL